MDSFYYPFCYWLTEEKNDLLTKLQMSVQLDFVDLSRVNSLDHAFKIGTRPVWPPANNSGIDPRLR